MMIFPKKLHRDTAPRTEASGHLPLGAGDGQRQPPDAWRVVLEDGSTSDRVCAGEGSTGAGGKLFEELAAALGSRAEAKGRRSRPRNVAMPSSPPQPLEALDDGLECKGGRPIFAAETVDHRAETPLVPRKLRPSPGQRLPPQQVPTEPKSPLPSGLDARLARVVDLWPRLPRGIQTAILAMIEVETADAR